MTREHSEDDCPICGAPSRDCLCEYECAVDGCASAPAYECGWCGHAICDAHANTYSGLCPDCQREHEDDQA